MTRYSVANAKNALPSLIDKALAGEEVIITRHGRPVAELRPRLDQDKRPSPKMYDWLRRGRDALAPIAVTSVEILDSMYEDPATFEQNRD
jgi:prevent-host-death family protein